jgi:hypothetical protein
LPRSVSRLTAFARVFALLIADRITRPFSIAAEHTSSPLCSFRYWDEGALQKF